MFLTSLFGIAFIIGIIALVKGGLPTFKIPNRKVAAIVTAISFLLWGVSIGISEEGEKKEIVQADQEKEKEEEEKKEESKEKKDEKKDNEKVEKKDSSPSIEEERKYYKEEILPRLDTVIEHFDRFWEEEWTDTFNELSEGKVDIYEAYSRLKNLSESKYGTLSKQLREIKGDINKDKMSKENQKLLKGFINDFDAAIYQRRDAVKQAMDMLDQGNFSPSAMDSILETVEIADGNMFSAIADKVTLENNYDMLEDDED